VQTDILIQNVSSQCIPNLVAVKTFRPNKVIWIYTREYSDTLNRLKLACGNLVAEQQQWLVNARDVEALHSVLQSNFKNLCVNGRVVFHLTGGTKSMALQGLINLGFFRRSRSADVLGVVMDPYSQYFDEVYPCPVNGHRTCATLTLDQILHVHGNAVHKPGHAMELLADRFDLLEKMRLLAPVIKRELQGRQIGRRDAEGFYQLSGKGGLPKAFHQGLEIAEQAGALRALAVSGERFRCTMQGSGDPAAWVRNTWMEDWAGAALGRGLSGWQGAGAGIEIRIGRKSGAGMDKQEFDFLGARNNHLVYWSCKNVQDVKPAYLFEVDALRDEVGGRDFHIAGLLYAGELKEGVGKKAQRLGVALVDVLCPEAAERLVKISGG